jgi:hypothetical protein
MDRRLQLETLLENLLGGDSDPEKKVQVYFQPPSNVTLQYPCIMYERERGDTKFAGNKPYRHTRRYQVTLVDPDPDSEIYDALAALPMTTHERWFAANNLNHDVFTTYF